jgi:hypothetical protein
MELTRGSPEIRIGLIDGPVARDHEDLAESPIQEILKRVLPVRTAEVLPVCMARTSPESCLPGEVPMRPPFLPPALFWSGRFSVTVACRENTRRVAIPMSSHPLFSIAWLPAPASST